MVWKKEKHPDYVLPVGATWQRTAAASRSREWSPANSSQGIRTKSSVLQPQRNGFCPQKDLGPQMKTVASADTLISAWGILTYRN